MYFVLYRNFRWNPRETQRSRESVIEIDTAKVFGETVEVPGLSGWLQDIEEQGFAVVPDWLNENRVAKTG